MTSPYPLTTTLNRIWVCDPCEEGKRKALAAAGKDAPDDEPITYAQIVEAVGFDDALWCCRAEPQYNQLWRLLAVWCAKRVQHLMTDARSVAALDVAERYANGQATEEELTAAHAEAYYAVSAYATISAAVAAASAISSYPVRAAASAAASARAAAAASASVLYASTYAFASASANAAIATAHTADYSRYRRTYVSARAAQRVAFIQLVLTGTLPQQ